MTDTPNIQFAGDEMRITFDAFDMKTYPLFLQAKRLPEYRIELIDRDAMAYAITAPARFAPMLGVQRPPAERPDLPIPKFLLDDQMAIVLMALDAKRFAVWSDCGNGKTLIELEFARQVAHRTGGRVLIVTRSELVDQFYEEAAKFYGDSYSMVRLTTRAQMKRWCETGEVDGNSYTATGGEVHGVRLSMREDRDQCSPETTEGTVSSSCVPELRPSRNVRRTRKDSQPVAQREEDATDASARGHHPADSARRRQTIVGITRVAIVNVEKFVPESEADQVVNECRHLAGFVLDEASILKSGGGVIKWALIKSARGILYKLAATATPAPNEIMEFASQASFLEKLRDEQEIIWTYFTRNEKTHRWSVKKHARRAFFEFMAGWSIYIRDPRRYGWRMNVPRPPEPEIIRHEIKITPEQRQFVIDYNASHAADGQASLYADHEHNAITSLKLSEAAKGFVYASNADALGELRENAREFGERFNSAAWDKAGSLEGAPIIIGGKACHRIRSLKPAFVADLVVKEILDGHRVLVWTVFDAETEILEREIVKAAGRANRKLKRKRDFTIDVLIGQTHKRQRRELIKRFKDGGSDVLISRAGMLGYGQNLQACTSMIFSGWTFSYEQFYQAVRRAVRHGQTKRVRVHIPVIPELEGQMYEAIARKDAQHEAAIAEMEASYIAARQAIGRAAA